MSDSVQGSSDSVQSSKGFVVGDIHGCARALEVVVKHMNLTSDDLVVILGDAVDRGPDTNRVLEFLLELQNSCKLIYIRGNHEEMMLDALEGRNPKSWLKHGGRETLDSYGGRPENIPNEHMDLLYATRDYWEGPTEICVHANLEPGVALSEQSDSWLRWQKLSGREFPHPSGKRVICGHSGVGYGAPLVRNGWICLDTVVYGGGVLSALNLATDEIIQARQSGEFRGGVFVRELDDTF